MIDSHCHLDHEPLFSNLDKIIKKSKSVGIDKILTICTSIASYDNILKIIDLDEMIYGTFGIHPHESNKDKLNKNEIVSKCSLNHKIIGVGETGLDFYYNNSDKKSQIESFQNHIEAALELKILMHCFTGTSEFAKKLININAYFSASGIITFNNSSELQKTFQIIPIEKLLIETDSPFLAPVPMRGEKNEPSFIKYTLKKLAEIKKLDEKRLDETTTNNFNKLFFDL